MPRHDFQCHDTDPDPNTYPDPYPPPKFNHLFTGPLPTSPENLMEIRLVVFVERLLTDKQTDKQTNNEENITSVAEVIT